VTFAQGQTLPVAAPVLIARRVAARRVAGRPSIVRPRVLLCTDRCVGTDSYDP
jgi:hypothetical protein